MRAGSPFAHPLAATRNGGFCVCLVAALFLFSPAGHAASVPADLAPASSLPQSGGGNVSTPPVRLADFQNHPAPDAVKQIADWVTNSGDSHGLPFVIVHKPEAKVFVFDKDGVLLGTASVLVGLTPGDGSVPGIGTMPLTAIDPQMRTTPAGRFVSTLGHDLGKLDVLWVDYPDAISLHRVINTNPAERRLERIVSPAPRDHRISYGCINVPADFFDTVVDPAFKDTKGVVYILPEIKSIGEVFPDYYDVNGNPGSPPAGVSARASP